MVPKDHAVQGTAHLSGHTSRPITSSRCLRAVSQTYTPMSHWAILGSEMALTARDSLSTIIDYSDYACQFSDARYLGLIE